MRQGISSVLIALAALLAISACDQPYTPPQPQRELSSFPVQSSQMPADLPGTGAITSQGITPPGSDSFAEGATMRVGLLLPLTGRHAELGRALQDAATLSLFDKYGTLSTRQATVTVELLPKDTGDTPEQAAQAMTEALAEGAQFIIGPLFADATEAAAPIARAKGVQVLSLSNQAGKGGNGIYMYGFSPQEQTARAIRHAVEAGRSRIGALVPESPLGTTVLTAARETLAKNGIVMVREARYPAAGIGIDAAINELIPASGAPEFDALLLPEGGPALGTILRALRTRGVTQQNVQLIGTGIWDDAALIRRVPLDGAWLASSPPRDTAAFENRFRSTYQYVPPRIASLAYDAVALAVTLATSGRPFDAPTLTSPAGFSGPANGIFRLRPDGRTERGLAVLEVQTGTFRVLSPAPNGFSE